MELLTFKEVAQRAGLPESTARWTKDRYSEWIPVIGEGRARRYAPQAVDVIRLAATMTRAGVPQNVIEAELSAHFERIIEAQRNTTTTTTPQDTTTTERNDLAPVDAAALAELIRAAVASEVAPLRDDLRSARREIAELRAALLMAERRALAAPPQETQETQPTTTPAPPSPLERLRRLIGR